MNEEPLDKYLKKQDKDHELFQEGEYIKELQSENKLLRALLCASNVVQLGIWHEIEPEENELCPHCMNTEDHHIRMFEMLIYEPVYILGQPADPPEYEYAGFCLACNKTFEYPKKGDKHLYPTKLQQVL